LKINLIKLARKLLRFQFNQGGYLISSVMDITFLWCHVSPCLFVVQIVRTTSSKLHQSKYVNYHTM